MAMIGLMVLMKMKHPILKLQILPLRTEKLRQLLLKPAKIPVKTRHLTLKPAIIPVKTRRLTLKPLNLPKKTKYPTLKPAKTPVKTRHLTLRPLNLPKKTEHPTRKLPILLTKMGQKMPEKQLHLKGLRAQKQQRKHLEKELKAHKLRLDPHPEQFPGRPNQVFPKP